MLEVRSQQLNTSARRPTPSINRSVSSIGRSLRQAVAELRPVTDVPRLEAEVLLAHVLEASRTMLLAHPERALTVRQLAN
ncbi:MAG: hypothetical protein U9R15_15475, partial [Chloroflexota bacterium]|nr:hypothetical protein [Chloroflexota bacterium]